MPSGGEIGKVCKRAKLGGEGVLPDDVHHLCPASAARQDSYVRQSGERPASAQGPSPRLFVHAASAATSSSDCNAGEKVNRLQMAATSRDKKCFDIFKDDPDIDVRLALLDNPNFKDEPWFQDFKILYESYKRLKVIAMGAFASAELKTLKRDVDLKAAIPNLTELLPFIARFEPSARVRYAVALNRTLTDTERSLFAEDSCLSIHRELGKKLKVCAFYKILKELEETRDQLGPGFKPREKLDAWKKELNNEGDYNDIISEAYILQLSEGWPSFESIANDYLPLLPLNNIITDRVIASGKTGAIDALALRTDYEFSRNEIEKMYALSSSDTAKARLMTQTNLSIHITEEYRKKFANDPARLLALADSPYVNVYYDQLLAGVKKYALAYAVFRNLASTGETIKRAIGLASIGDRDKAILLKNKNTPIELRRVYACDPLVFHMFCNEKKLDDVIDRFYLSNDFTSEEKARHLAMIQSEMAKFYEKGNAEYEHFNFFASRHAPREALRHAILHSKRKGLFWADCVAQFRNDLTKEELTAMLKWVPEQAEWATLPHLYAHPNIDSGVIIEVVEYAGRIKKESRKADGCQTDFLVSYLSSHAPDERLKAYVYARLQEKQGTEGFNYWDDVALAMAGPSLDIFNPGMPFANELKQAVLSEVGMTLYKIALVGSKEAAQRLGNWEKADDTNLELWKKIIASGRAGEFVAAYRYDVTAGNDTRLLIARTPGLSPEIYRQAFEREIADRKRFNEERKKRPNDLSLHHPELDGRIYFAFLKDLWDNPSIPNDLLVKSKDAVEVFDQTVALSEAMTKKGISDRELLFAWRAKVKHPLELIKLAELYKKRGYDDPELFTFAKMLSVLREGGEQKRMLDALHGIYDENPSAFMKALDAFPDLFLPADFLPENYKRRGFYSSDPGKVGSFGALESFFDEIYLADHGNINLGDLLRGKTKFTRALILTMIPTLNITDSFRAGLEGLIRELEKITLFDNSFLEYYLASQMFVVRDAFSNGFVAEDAKIPFLKKMISMAISDVENFGKSSDKEFFAGGRRRLLVELLKSSIFAERISPASSDSDLLKWEMFLHLGVRGLAHFGEFERMRREIDVRGVYESGFLGMTVESGADFPAHLKDDFLKASFVASERVKGYLASPNPERAKKLGLQKENAFYDEGTLSGDMSLVGGLSTYGANIEATFYAELGHHYSGHVFPTKQNAVRLMGVRERMNPMSLYEFDDRMAGSAVPLSLENPERLKDVLDAYRSLDGAYLALARKIISELGMNGLASLYQTCKGTRPEKFSSRRDWFLFSNATAVLGNMTKGIKPDTFDLLVLGEGMHTAWKEGAVVFPWPDMMKTVAKKKDDLGRIPAPERLAVEGVAFISTYGNSYPMNGVPVEPIIPEKRDAKGRPDFSYLNEDEQHRTAEWLVYYTKRHARALLAGGKISPDEYFYFIKNVPFATKLLLDGNETFDMSDVIARIKELTPEKFGRLLIDSRRPMALDAVRANRWIHRLDERFRQNRDWTLDRLEAEIARTRGLQ